MMVQKSKTRNVSSDCAPSLRHGDTVRPPMHEANNMQCTKLSIASDSRAQRTGMTGLDRVVMGDMVNRPSPPS
jgi:hypothetical protein